MYILLVVPLYSTSPTSGVVMSVPGVSLMTVPFRNGTLQFFVNRPIAKPAIAAQRMNKKREMMYFMMACIVVPHDKE